MVTALTSDAFFRSKSEQATTHRLKKQGFFGKSFSILTVKERRRFISLSILDFFVAVVDIFSLAFLLWMIHFYTLPVGGTIFLPKWIGSQNSLTLLGGFVFLFGLKNLMAYLIAKAQNNFISKVAVRLSKESLRKYQQSPFNEFIGVDSSVQIRKIAYEPFEFCQYVLSAIQQLFTQCSLIVLTVAAILFFNAQLFFLLVIILVPPTIGIFYFVRKRLAKKKHNIKTSNQQSLQYLLEALKGYVEGNVYNRNDFFLNRFISYREKFSSYLFNSISLQTLPGRLVEIFAVFGLFALVLISKLAGVADGSMFLTIGAFLASAYKIIPGIVKIVNISGQMKAHEPVINNLAVTNTNITNTSVVPSNIHSIEFSDISFNYGVHPIINKLSFTLQKGDFMGIAGNSGKGKTTILNLLLGFLSPDTGNILINSESAFKEDLKKFWRRIAYVRQQSFFIHDTILKNITLEENEVDEKRFHLAIEVSGLQDLIAGSSEGLNKIIAENGKNISGGQQQRIALARALYKDADLLLLDEPFNELDEASELLLLHHLQQMANNGKMVVMITHNKKALSFCNKIIALDD